MGIRRTWAYLLAAASLVLFVVGLGTALAPPAPDCGDEASVYCLEAGYAKLRAVILGSWILGIALLGAAVWVLFAARRAPPPQPRAAAAPSQTQDGRRIVSVQQGRAHQGTVRQDAPSKPPNGSARPVVDDARRAPRSDGTRSK